MAREAAARRIQKWCRQHQSRRAVAARIAATRQRWCAKYSSTLPQNQIQSSTANDQTPWTSLLTAAIRIQRAWRDFVAYRNAIFGFSPARRSKLKTQPHQQQSQQISSRVINAIAHFGADVKQLQQVCVVQEVAMTELWDNMARLRRYLDYRIDKAVVRFQVGLDRWLSSQAGML